MAITYEWEIEKVDVYTEHEQKNNVIWNVHWKLNAIDSDVDALNRPYRISADGQQELNITELNDFIEFENVTKSQVEAWLEKAKGEIDLQYLKNHLSNLIDELKNPTSVTKVLVN